MVEFGLWLQDITTEKTSLFKEIDMEVIWTYVATIVFTWFFLLWKTSDWLNTTVKFFLLLLAAGGWLISLKYLGVIFII